MKEGTSISDSGSLEILSEDPAETLALARRLGLLLTGGEALALDGPLGAGKTCLVKGLAEGLGIDPREVTSPTFLLIHEIPGRLLLAHLDAYRVGDPQTLIEMGAAELLTEESVLVVEWADRVPEVLPPDHLRISLEHVEVTSRRLRFCASGPRHLELLRRFARGAQDSRP